jgi:hypothetical protein
MSATPPPPEEPTRPMDTAAPGGVDAVEHPVDDDRDRRGGWVIWAIVGLVLLGLVLFALLGGDDERTTELTEGDGAEQWQTEAPADDAGAGDDPAPEGGVGAGAAEEAGAGEGATQDGAVHDGAAQDGTAGAAPETGAETGAEDGAEAPATADDADDPGAILTAGGEELLALLEGDDGDAERLAPHAGSDVEGQGVRIQQVVDERHFWVGTDTQRIFVHLGPDMTAEGVEIAEGQRIAFEGFLKENPPADSAEVHDLTEDEGAEEHRRQGHHIELTTIAPG